MTGLTARKLALTLMIVSGLTGCEKWGAGNGRALDRLKPDAEAHARSLDGEDMADARETGLTLLSRLGALAEW